MATTYLTLSNEVLRELNEVQLTSSNFSDASLDREFSKIDWAASIIEGYADRSK